MATPAAKPPKAPTLIVFRRVRYEGATLRTLTLRRDGTFRLDIPGGGAGGSAYDGTVKTSTLHAVEREVRRVPWGHIGGRKVVFNRSGAYFILRHGRDEHVAMASGVPADVLPLVRRLNAVVDGHGIAHRKLEHRFYTR